MAVIDLNSDLGESFGHYTIGCDDQVIPLVTSANVACGFHAGDASVMRNTVTLALQAGIGIGAHPGYPDLQGFGRRAMNIAPADAYDLVLYQIGALAAHVKVQGGTLQHVKPHGALYNRAAVDAPFAWEVARAVHDFDPDLVLVALASGELVKAGRAQGLRVAEEYFVDRNYNDDGTLADRTKPGAMITDEAEALSRAVRVIKTGTLTSLSGAEIELHADTICIHGDGPKALAFANTLRKHFADEGIQIQAMGKTLAEE